MKAEPHTMTLKTKQHSWLRGVQFFRKHIMWGMWTRAWLSLFCLCFFLSFFILRLSGLCTADEHSVSLPDLTYALTSYRVREHLAHVKMLVKSFLDLPPQSLLISYLFFFFFLPNLSLGEFVRSWHSGDSAWIPNKHKVVRTVSAGWLEAVYDCTRRQPWRV